MKIQINNISPVIPDTYGYFSLGDIDFGEDEVMSLLDSFDSILECSCTYCDLEFKLVAIKNGLFRRYTVLSDFQKLPDYAVIENEEVLEAAKESIRDYIITNEKKHLFSKLVSSVTSTFEGSTTISDNNNNYYASSILPAASTKVY